MSLIPAQPTAIDVNLANDAACTLVELSCNPTDVELQARAIGQLPPLHNQLRTVTGQNNDDDLMWLRTWAPLGIVIERN